MNTPHDETVRNDPEAPRTDSPLGCALAFSVPLITLLQSAALADARATYVSSGTAANIPCAAVAECALMMDPPTLVAAGAAIASIGAYRLMKMQGRKEPGAEDPSKS